MVVNETKLNYFSYSTIVYHEEIIVLDNTVFSGAYSFAKNKAAIFVVDDHGVGEVVELHLVRKSDGDMLCERVNGKSVVWFCRSKEQSMK